MPASAQASWSAASGEGARGAACVGAGGTGGGRDGSGSRGGALEGGGFSTALAVGGSSLRVDVRTDHHAHLVCEQCGHVQDVDVDEAAFVPPRSQRDGFTVDRTDVVFWGRCAACRH